LMSQNPSNSARDALLNGTSGTPMQRAPKANGPAGSRVEPASQVHTTVPAQHRPPQPGRNGAGMANSANKTQAVGGGQPAPSHESENTISANAAAAELRRASVNYDGMATEDVAELKRLDAEMKKMMMRTKKVFDNRMDNLQRTQSQREAQHKKSVEKHQKDRVEFEKRIQQEEIEQNRRLEQLQREWELKRQAVHHKQEPPADGDSSPEG